MHAETHGLKVRRRPGPGNPPESEKYEHKATDLPFRVCAQCVAGKIPDLPHKGHSSDRDVHETKMDHSFANRRTDSWNMARSLLPYTSKAERSDENLLADADGLHI